MSRGPFLDFTQKYIEHGKNRLTFEEQLVTLHAEQDRMAQELEIARAAAHNRPQLVDDPNCPLRDYTAPRADEIRLGYTAPNILTKEYQISPGWVTMVQRHVFHGLPHEDATQHLTNFEEICSTIKVNTISDEDLKWMDFTLSLADKVKSWIRCQRSENMDTWAKIINVFLNKFFPLSKTNNIRHQIHNFR
jgi:hypothetical protein